MSSWTFFCLLFLFYSGCPGDAIFSSKSKYERNFKYPTMQFAKDLVKITWNIASIPLDEYFLMMLLPCLVEQIYLLLRVLC